MLYQIGLSNCRRALCLCVCVYLYDFGTHAIFHRFTFNGINPPFSLVSILFAFVSINFCRLPSLYRTLSPICQPIDWPPSLPPPRYIDPQYIVRAHTLMIGTSIPYGMCHALHATWPVSFVF